LFWKLGKADEAAKALKEYYEEEIRNAQLRHVVFHTTYLSFSDYATLLGSADLGISLHVSSSKKDLPMKVVDMFGCELPVLAIQYEWYQIFSFNLDIHLLFSIGELVVEGTGYCFATHQELSRQMMVNLHSFSTHSLFPKDMLEGFEGRGEEKKLQSCRIKIREWMRSSNWDTLWKERALPHFLPQK